MILDAVAWGTMLTVDAKQATRIIYALTSTDYQVQHENYVGLKKGVLELNTIDVLAQNKILTQ